MQKGGSNKSAVGTAQQPTQFDLRIPENTASQTEYQDWAEVVKYYYFELKCYRI
jgi:hypothetical protein